MENFETDSPIGRSADPVGALMRRGDELARVPRSQVDIRWHVEAFLVGDLPALALASARMREPGSGVDDPQPASA